MMNWQGYMSQDSRKSAMSPVKKCLLYFSKWVVKKLEHHEMEIGTAIENRYPEGVDYFRDATYSMYNEGLEEWQKNEGPDSLTWPNYMAFISTGWYQDGLMAWRNTAWRKEADFRKIYEEVVRNVGSDFNIEWRTHVLLYFARLAKETSGAFVEFGTGKGWMATAIASSGLLHESDKKMYLFDTFAPEKVDQSSGTRLSGETDPHYAIDPDSISPLLLSDDRIFCVVGDVRETLLPNLMCLKEVAFVHFDLNSADMEELCFRAVFPKLQRGCVIVLDDYGFINLEAQQVTWDKLSAEFEFSILSLPTGQGIIQL
jgi:hypothetical protein